jgi:hypothetical protein
MRVRLIHIEHPSDDVSIGLGKCRAATADEIEICLDLLVSVLKRSPTDTTNLETTAAAPVALADVEIPASLSIPSGRYVWRDEPSSVATG